MDEDNEMVSMTSQSDLDEALNIEELHTLKLTFKVNPKPEERKRKGPEPWTFNEKRIEGINRSMCAREGCNLLQHTQ